MVDLIALQAERPLRRRGLKHEVLLHMRKYSLTADAINMLAALAYHCNRSYSEMLEVLIKEAYKDLPESATRAPRAFHDPREIGKGPHGTD